MLFAEVLRIVPQGRYDTRGLFTFFKIPLRQMLRPRQIPRFTVKYREAFVYFYSSTSFVVNFFYLKSLPRDLSFKLQTGRETSFIYAVSKISRGLVERSRNFALLFYSVDVCE